MSETTASNPEYNAQLKADPFLSQDVEEYTGIQKGFQQIQLGKTQQGLQNPKTSAADSLSSKSP